MDEVTDGKVKGGEEKLRIKLRKELSEAGKDPKQRKLSFLRRTKSHIKEARDIDPVSTEGEPTLSNTMTPSGPVERVAEESKPYPKRTGSGDLDGKLADGEPPLPTTVQKVIRSILKNMRKAIVNKIGEKSYIIEMDTTQDAGVVDQALIVLRYVKYKEIHERLFAVVHVLDSSGKAKNEFLQAKIEDQGLTKDSWDSTKR